MTVLTIDPGSEQSAWVLWDGARVLSHGKQPNAWLLAKLTDIAFHADVLVLEQIASYGMPVGAEVFSTVRWAGRFEQRALEHGWTRVEYVPRAIVKLHLCHSARANDATIRCAIVDRFGGKERAIGRKANQGPLFGLKADTWSAMGLALTFHDLHVQAPVGAAVGQ